MCLHNLLKLQIIVNISFICQNSLDFPENINAIELFHEKEQMCWELQNKYYSDLNILVYYTTVAKIYDPSIYSTNLQNSSWEGENGNNPILKKRLK